MDPFGSTALHAMKFTSSMLRFADFDRRVGHETSPAPQNPFQARAKPRFCEHRRSSARGPIWFMHSKYWSNTIARPILAFNVLLNRHGRLQLLGPLAGGAHQNFPSEASIGYIVHCLRVVSIVRRLRRLRRHARSRNRHAHTRAAAHALAAFHTSCNPLAASGLSFSSLSLVLHRRLRQTKRQCRQRSRMSSRQ